MNTYSLAAYENLITLLLFTFPQAGQPGQSPAFEPRAKRVFCTHSPNFFDTMDSIKKYNICPCWYSNRYLNKEHKATETGKRLAEEDNKKMLVR